MTTRKPKNLNTMPGRTEARTTVSGRTEARTSGGISGNASAGDGATRAGSSGISSRAGAARAGSYDASSVASGQAPSRGDFSDNPAFKDIAARHSASRQARKKNRTLRTVSIIIIIIAAAAFVFASYKLISALTTYNTAKDSYSEIRDMFRETRYSQVSSSGSGSTSSGGSSGSGSDATSLGASDNAEGNVSGELSGDVYEEWVFDFDKLCAMNSDAIGYIQMQGSGSDIVDYPVVQGSDNDYYLDHLFDGSYNSSGAIFMDCYAEYGFDSSYAIIYGHNMKSGSRMFGCLDGYKDYSFFEEHMLWDVYAGSELRTYRTFSAFTASVDSFVYEYYSEGEIPDLAEAALDASDYDMGLSPSDFDEGSQILCLSTCLDNYSETERYVVFLVRVD